MGSMFAAIASNHAINVALGTPTKKNRLATLTKHSLPKPMKEKPTKLPTKYTVCPVSDV